MTNDLLTRVIVQTFNEKVGKWQSRNATPMALKVSFSLTLDYDKEEGSRNLDLVIYGPENYVGVWTRENWDVISLEDLDDEGDIMPGKDYVKGDSGWVQVGCHDSGWRSVIHDVLAKYSKKITGFEHSSFYEVVEVAKTGLQEEAK